MEGEWGMFCGQTIWEGSGEIELKDFSEALTCS